MRLRPVGKIRLDLTEVHGSIALPLKWGQARFILCMPNNLYLLGAESATGFHNVDYHHK